MSDTAAQPEQEPSGVPPGEFPDDLAGELPLDPHQAVIEEVAAARLEELREDGLDIPPADAGEIEDGETPPPEPEGDGATREPVPEEPLYTVKIDGEERQVPLSEITASYQIQSAAQNRLNQAEAILRQTQVQGVQERPAAPAPVAQQQPSDGLDAIDWGGVAEKLQYGEGEVPGNALKDLVVQLRDTGRGSGGAVPSVDQVEMRVLEKLEWTTALRQFGDDYPDIVADDHVGRIAGSIGRTLYQQAIQDSQLNGTPRRPYYEIFKDAGERTRDWLNGLGVQQAGDSDKPTPPKPNGEQPAVNLSEERGQRKRAAPQPPTPRSGVARSGARRDKTPKSDEQRQREGIADIQRARGQR